MDILGFDWSIVWSPGCITMRFSDVSYDIKKNFLCWKFNHSWQFRNSSLAFEFPSSAWWTHFNVMGNWIWYSYWLNFIKLNFRSCSSLGICQPPPPQKKTVPIFWFKLSCNILKRMKNKFFWWKRCAMFWNGFLSSWVYFLCDVYFLRYGDFVFYLRNAFWTKKNTF